MMLTKIDERPGADHMSLVLVRVATTLIGKVIAGKRREAVDADISLRIRSLVNTFGFSQANTIEKKNQGYYVDMRDLWFTFGYANIRNS